MATKANIPFSELPDAAFVRVQTVAPLLSAHPSSVWRWAKDGSIPAPKKIAARVTGWNVGELRRFLSDKAEA